MADLSGEAGEGLSLFVSIRASINVIVSINRACRFVNSSVDGYQGV